LAFIVCLGGNIAIDRYSKTLASEQSKIEQIKERSEMCNEIAAFTEEKSACFGHLDMINNVRPAKLLFNQLSTNNPKVMTFAGTSDSVHTLNTFIENLRKEKSITKVSTINVVSTLKGTTFNLQIEFL
jgi:Tfp pilus assembly protein PilN